MLDDTLSKDIIKASVEISEKDDHFVTDSNFASKFNQLFNERFEVSYDERYDYLFTEILQDLIKDRNAHKKEIAELKDKVEKLNLSLKMMGHNPETVVDLSKEGSKHITELRAKQVFPILCEEKQLSPGDIIRICKLGKKGHEKAHRVMDMAQKLYPDDCRHKNSNISGKAKHWLVHKDHIGFKD